MYLQELSAVDAECRHLELRWRSETAARSLANIAVSARETEIAAAARLERLEKRIQSSAEAAAAAAAETSSRLAAQLTAAGRSIDDVERRVTAAAAAAAEHENAEASRFRGLNSSLDDALRGVGRVSDGVSDALLVAEQLREHASVAMSTLEGIASSVKSLAASTTSWWVSARDTIQRAVTIWAVIAVAVPWSSSSSSRGGCLWFSLTAASSAFVLAVLAVVVEFAAIPRLLAAAVRFQHGTTAASESSSSSSSSYSSYSAGAAASDDEWVCPLRSVCVSSSSLLRAATAPSAEDGRGDRVRVMILRALAAGTLGLFLFLLIFITLLPFHHLFSSLYVTTHAMSRAVTVIVCRVYCRRGCPP